MVKVIGYHLSPFGELNSCLIDIQNTGFYVSSNSGQDCIEQSWVTDLVAFFVLNCHQQLAILLLDNGLHCTRPDELSALFLHVGLDSLCHVLVKASQEN